MHAFLNIYLQACIFLQTYVYTIMLIQIHAYSVLASYMLVHNYVCTFNGLIDTNHSYLMTGRHTRAKKILEITRETAWLSAKFV